MFIRINSIVQPKNWEPLGKRRSRRLALRWETYIGHAMENKDLREGDWNLRELWREKTANS